MTDQKTQTLDELKQAGEGRNASLLGEFFEFARQNKKWWLLPIVMTLLLLGLLVALSGTALAPFIYPLF